ncbi:MAG: metallophosphoesterase [Methanobrevibacter sp.]|nr:metallophosphoesterase [Methanobrevibacter sp.]
MKIGLISDTHITEKRGKLSEKVLKTFNGVDLILHAGDISSQIVLDELSQKAPTIAVEGNNDRTHKTLDLNPIEIIEISDLKILLTHGDKLPSGKFNKYHEFAQKHDADILISGHSHKPHLEKIENILLINPGSPNRPLKSDASIAILTIDEAKDYKNKLDKVNVEFIKIEK